MSEVRAEYHASHDCVPGQCICKCGCTQIMGCRSLSGFCSRCHIASNWDDAEHGFKADGAEQSVAMYARHSANGWQTPIVPLHRLPDAGDALFNLVEMIADEDATNPSEKS